MVPELDKQLAEDLRSFTCHAHRWLSREEDLILQKCLILRQTGAHALALDLSFFVSRPVVYAVLGSGVLNAAAAVTVGRRCHVCQLYGMGVHFVLFLSTSLRCSVAAATVATSGTAKALASLAVVGPPCHR